MNIDEIIKEEIDYQINSKNNIWYAFIADMVGIFFLVILIIKYKDKNKRLEYLIYLHHRRESNA